VAGVIEQLGGGGTKKLGRVAKVAVEQSFPPLRLTTARATRRRLSSRGAVVDENQIAAALTVSGLTDVEQALLSRTSRCSSSRGSVREFNWLQNRESSVLASAHPARLKLNSNRSVEL
jgi:hypothetical protein